MKVETVCTLIKPAAVTKLTKGEWLARARAELPEQLEEGTNRSKPHDIWQGQMWGPATGVKQLLAAAQATAELCRQNSTAKYIQYTWKPLPPPAQHLCIGALLGHSVSLISCVSPPVCPLPSSQKDGASLKCSHLSQKSQVYFLLFLSASTRCISYKCTRRPSALHSSPVHNYYFIVFLQTRLFSRMWLESVLEVRPFQSCNQQDWTCS